MMEYKGVRMWIDRLAEGREERREEKEGWDWECFYASYLRYLVRL